MKTHQTCIMKPLLLLLALMLCVCARADLAEVKRVLDEPVVLRYEDNPFNYKEVKAAVEKITGVKIKEVGNLPATRRQLFGWLGQTQGRTTKDLATLHGLTRSNTAKLRELLPALKAANLTAAASDLEEALQSIETSKTLDRAAQDRFARLARVAL